MSDEKLQKYYHFNQSKGGFTQYPFFVRFVRFFRFLLLREQVCPFPSAFLYVHIRTNQSVTYWAKTFRKKIFAKGHSPILKYRSYGFEL